MLAFGIVVLVVVPIALHLLGADVEVRRCFRQTIPCGWSWKFYGSGP